MVCTVTRMTETFRRDRLTWIAYVMLAWFAYLQAAPGLVIVHLRNELHLSYSTGGLHVAAFAAGSMVAGVISARLEGALGRRRLFWSSAALMGVGVVGLGGIAAVTVGSVLVMGVGGGLLLVTIQAALADHRRAPRGRAGRGECGRQHRLRHPDRHVVDDGSAARAGGSRCWPRSRSQCWRGGATDGWRSTPPQSRVAQGRLPGVFWIAAAMLFCTTAAEWCITAWGATFIGKLPTCRLTARSR